MGDEDITEEHVFLQCSGCSDYRPCASGLALCGKCMSRVGDGGTGREARLVGLVRLAADAIADVHLRQGILDMLKGIR